MRNFCFSTNFIPIVVINRASQNPIKKLNFINFVDGVVKNKTINYQQAGRKIFVEVKEYFGLINRT